MSVYGLWYTLTTNISYLRGRRPKNWNNKKDRISEPGMGSKFLLHRYRPNFKTMRERQRSHLIEADDLVGVIELVAFAPQDLHSLAPLKSHRSGFGLRNSSQREQGRILGFDHQPHNTPSRGNSSMQSLRSTSSMKKRGLFWFNDIITISLSVSLGMLNVFFINFIHLYICISMMDF